MSNRNRARLREARARLDSAAEAYQDVVYALDAEYATQEVAWQEGEPGQASCRQTETLRTRIAALQKMAGEDLG